MGRELRVYRLAERVMKYTENQFPYELVLKKSRDFCRKSPRRLSDMFSHVGDSYAARVIAEAMTGKRFY